MHEIPSLDDNINITRVLLSSLNQHMEDLSLSRDVDSEIDLYSETIEIRRSILCIICLGTYFNPVRLPCSHTFCGHCILEASRVKLRCPICSAEFSKRSINRVPNISEVIAEIDALVKSLTSDNRFSIPIEKLDEQYRERQKAVHSESQHTRSIPSSSLQPAVFDERENISKLCGTINVDVDIPSSSYFELVTSGISDTASSSSNDGACADPCQSVSGQRDRALLPVFSSSTSSQNQSLHTDLLVSEIVSDSHSSDGPLVLACTDYTCKEPEREIVPTRRKESQMEAAETSGVITTSFPSSSGMDPSDPLLSTETPVTAQLVHRNCSGIDITDAAFRPGEVVEVSSRMWPGQGVFVSICTSIFFYSSPSVRKKQTN